MHALIIEAHGLVRMMLEQELRRLGFASVDVATTQDEAIAAAKLRAPDLITTGVRLGQGNGIEAVRNICEDRSIPTIYIASNRDEVRNAVSGSVVATRPILPRELEQAVRQVTQGVAA